MSDRWVTIGGRKRGRSYLEPVLRVAAAEAERLAFIKALEEHNDRFVMPLLPDAKRDVFLVTAPKYWRRRYEYLRRRDKRQKATLVRCARKLGCEVIEHPPVIRAL